MRFVRMLLDLLRMFLGALREKTSFVVLNNGARVRKWIVHNIVLDVRFLMRTNFPALLELVRLCSNPNHKLTGAAEEVLRKRQLVKRGAVSKTVRNVVVSAIQVDGREVWRINPIAVQL